MGACPHPRLWLKGAFTPSEGRCDRPRTKAKTQLYRFNLEPELTSTSPNHSATEKKGLNSGI